MDELLNLPISYYISTMNGKKKDIFNTNLRLPKKLAKRVKEVAEVNKRSMNAEIEYALTVYLNKA